jgi:hypothetical protein
VILLGKDKEKRDISKIDTDDGWNRTFYGSPTVGGIIVVVIVLYFILRL